MRVLDLFSGIGGFSLGLERAGMETVAFCEIEDYPTKVLRKHWPDVPIFKDVRKLNKEALLNEGVGSIDVICGGYPCQPFSLAGRRRGKEDDRHLWPEMFRLITSGRPRWIIAENVIGHVKMGLDHVLSDLEGESYTATTIIIPAASVGANHNRERVWIIAHSDDTRLQAGGTKRNDGDYKVVEGWSLQEHLHKIEEFAGSFRAKEVAAESRIPRVNDGVPNRVDRNRALGNAVHPEIPEMIGRAIMAIESA